MYPRDKVVSTSRTGHKSVLHRNPGMVHIYTLGMKLSSALEDRALIYTTPDLITGRKQVNQADSASAYPFLPTSTHMGQPSPVDTVNSVNRAQSTLS